MPDRLLSPSAHPHRRRIGTLTGPASDGLAVIAVGGLHGNEPAGIRAIERIVAALRDRPIAGTFIGVAGNLAALAQGRRFLSRDLNRAFTERMVADVRGLASPEGEDREQRELADLVLAVSRRAQTTWLIDLHTTSAEGPPFCVMADRLCNRDLAFSLPIPTILGLEEYIEGTLLSWAEAHGCMGVTIEGGQHDLHSSVDHLEAALWIGLDEVGLVSLPTEERAGWEAHLREAAPNTPHILEVVHRHPVRDGDGFEMEPGFHNFNPIRRGEVLASDHKGQIQAGHHGYLLMPSYQKEGDDGFFESREVAGAWLTVSEMVRQAGLERALHHLPGVDRDPREADVYWADLRIARLWTSEVFHLLGYQRIREEAGRRAFRRRRDR